MSLPTPFQDFIHLSRYSRWTDEKARRETWEETVSRYFDFFVDHLEENQKYKVSKTEKEELQSAIVSLDVMPSMRALMTAGEALKRDHVAGYNCAYVSAGRVRSFDEILYILMCGTGVGFSVERDFLDKLATIAEEFEATDTTIVVQDSKLGWAKAYKDAAPGGRPPLGVSEARHPASRRLPGPQASRSGGRRKPPQQRM